ncbi:MAG: PEP-utilizing enzyme [Actinomycetota bacterium]|nr:PEP-utilizing enzyme [Actinomycetota bacterium]
MGAFRTDWDTAANPRYDVWTTTNGGEVIPGVLSPFTATMYNQFDARGLRDLMKPYPSGNLVKVYSPPVGNFFGIMAGRLTLNVGFSVAAMSCLDPDIATAMAGQFFQGSDDALRYIVRAPADQVARAMEVATEQREAAEAQSRADQEELYAERLQGVPAHDRELPLQQAWKRFHELVPSTLEIFNRHLVVSTAAGEMSVRLAGVIDAGGGDPNTIIGLCSGLGDVESSKPALKLYDLALVARKHAAVRKVVESGDTAAVIAALAAPPDKGWEAFADEFDEFIHRYGFRVQGEADPMVADWGENPTFVISQVRSMMALKPSESPAAHQKAAAAARVKLEKAVRATLSPAVRPAFDDALAQAQRFTAMRELTKAVWVLATRRLRPPLLATADGLVAAGHLKKADAMQYLTHAEVDSLVKGKPVDGIAASIATRRKQHKQAHEYTLPDAWVGDVVPAKRAKVVATTSLSGLGVSAGIATGRARIVLNTEAAFEREIESGDILVAPFTDTPWTPLFIPAAAVVVETGGMLSHAATVAREFGIPCVVLVHDATRIIGDGDTVTVDGAAGTVKIVKRAK